MAVPPLMVTVLVVVRAFAVSVVPSKVRFAESVRFPPAPA